MSLNRLAAVTAALFALAGAQSAGAQAVSAAVPTTPQPPVAPEARHFKLGALELIVLHDADVLRANNGKLFGLNASAAEVGQVLAAAGAPTDMIATSVNVLLVKAPGRVIMFDSGYGPNGAAHGMMTASLALTGVKPDEVTDVLITHGHPDHVGGLLGADGKSTFPKATIHIAATEWAWMQTQARNKDLVAAISPQVKTFELGQAVLPGITPIAIEGHTPGHVGYEIVSQGRKLTDIGDAAHSSIVSLARPDWTVAFDGDKPVGAASRRALLTRLAAGHELVFATHFPFPGLGRVDAAKEGFTWKPGLDPAK